MRSIKSQHAPVQDVRATFGVVLPGMWANQSLRRSFVPSFQKKTGAVEYDSNNNPGLRNSRSDARHLQRRPRLRDRYYRNLLRGMVALGDYSVIDCANKGGAGGVGLLKSLEVVRAPGQVVS